MASRPTRRPPDGRRLTATQRALVYDLLRRELERSCEMAAQQGATPEALRALLDERLRCCRLALAAGSGPLVSAEDLEHRADELVSPPWIVDDV